MPKRYAREFRRAVNERLLAGERVRDVASDVGVSKRRSSSGSTRR
jgi:transposase-like protein